MFWNFVEQCLFLCYNPYVQKNPWDDTPIQEEPKANGDGFNFRVRSKIKNMDMFPTNEKWIIFVIFGFIIIWLLTGFYVVDPKQVGVEMVFGRFLSKTGPGLHYNYPEPIGSVYKPSVTTINQVNVGFQKTQPILAESQMLTGDENILNVQFVVFWKIRNPVQYLFFIKDPNQTVKNVSEAAMREIIGQTAFELARTTGRTQVASSVKTLIQKILDLYDSGIEIVDLNIQRVDPPEKVINAFRDVQAARADQERSINEAIGYKNRVIQHAQGMADQIAQEAQAYEQEKINLAEGETKRFLQLEKQYRQNPQITKNTLYLQIMQNILGSSNKLIIDSILAKNLTMLPFIGYLNPQEKKILTPFTKNFFPKESNSIKSGLHKQ